MAIDDELEWYLERLAGVLGHADRRVGLMDSCRGLMRPIKRKSIRPLDPQCLVYPKVSSLAAGKRAAACAGFNCLTAAAYRSEAIARQLMQCPYCGMINRDL